MATKMIGRKTPLVELQKGLHSNRPELVAVTGRRRVGKTFLVRSALEGLIDFEMTGIKNGPKQLQLHNFTLQVSSYFPSHQIEKQPETWLAAFSILTGLLEGLAKEEKIVVFLDELPWMATKRSGFLQGFSYFWNSWASTKDILVVICGSAAAWMIEKVISDKGGLHNRVTRMIHVAPFTLAETEEFLRSKRIKLDRYQILQLYMAIGGIPMYLEHVESGLSAVQNIQNICFRESGFLRTEFDRLYSSLFDNYQHHVAIVRALAKKRKGLTRLEVIDATSIANGGTLTKTLNELYQSGFISIHGSYGKKKKQSLYRLADPYSLFYLSFIESQSFGAEKKFTDISNLPRWQSWSGYTFEYICLAHISQIRKALGISGIASSIASFYAKGTSDSPGAQIDLVIDRSDRTINICEMKFSYDDYLIDKKFVDNLRQKKSVFRLHTKTKKHLFSTMITTFGVVDNAHRLNHIDQVVIMDDLFES